MSFFMSADYSQSTKVMEIIYFIIGLLCIYCGVKNLKDKENPEPVGTFIFWAVLGVVLALGRWLPSLVSGILVVVMCIPAILKKVKKGAVSAATKAETEATYEKIGMKIFVPTLSIGMLAVICAITGMGIGLSALNGVALGVLVAIILLMIVNRDNKPSTFLNDSERMLSTVGPLSMLPMFTIMMFFRMPIMLAAMPTHPSRCARSVSIKSRPIATSTFVAGSPFCPRKKGSFIISRTICPPIFPQFPLRIRFREGAPPGLLPAATPLPCYHSGECR